MNRRVPRTCVRSWIGFACTHETRRPSPNTWLKAPMRKLMAFLPKCNVFSFLPSVNFHEYENYLDFSCRYIPAFRFYPWLCSSNYSFDLDKTDSEIYKLYLWKKYEIILKENFRSFSQSFCSFVSTSIESFETILISKEKWQDPRNSNRCF